MEIRYLYIYIYFTFLNIVFIYISNLLEVYLSIHLNQESRIVKKYKKIPKLMIQENHWQHRSTQKQFFANNRLDHVIKVWKNVKGDYFKILKEQTKSSNTLSNFFFKIVYIFMLFCYYIQKKSPFVRMNLNFTHPS